MIAGIGAVFYYTNIVEGDLVGDSDSGDCEPTWFTPTDSDTGEPYTSKDALREDVADEYPDWNETQLDRYMEDTEIAENGTVGLPEVCQ